MDERLNNALSFINSHLSEKITMDELAQESCTSYRNLLRLFRMHLNTTPHKYIEQIKVRKSLQLIIDEENSVQDISAALGYKNYETFSKVFSKNYQISPGDLQGIIKYIKLIWLKNKSQALKIEIGSTSPHDLSGYLARWDDMIRQYNCTPTYKAFIASRKPISAVANGTMIKKKYYVSGY